MRDGTDLHAPAPLPSRESAGALPCSAARPIGRMGADPDRRALVLGAGGILGAAYEVGVLAALEERFGEGVVYESFDLFVGTSAGSFVAVLVGQGVAPGRLYRAFVDQDPALFVRPRDMFRVDWGHLARGATALQWALARAVVSSLARGRVSPILDLFSSGLDHLPAGFLTLDPLDACLRRIFARSAL